MIEVSRHLDAPRTAAGNHPHPDPDPDAEPHPHPHADPPIDCDICGAEMLYTASCKLRCSRCGYTRDCTDP